MIGSIWRYSHFLLAAVSAVFLLMASITGAILAFEPVSEAARPYHQADLSEVYLGETIGALRERFPEVLELEVTPEHFVRASVLTEEGQAEDIFIHARTGEKLGEVHAQTPFFAFMTNFHRSLFLKSAGRFFVGLVSLLLCFIAITGVFLLAQRQGGFRRWFSKVQELDFRQRYHVRFGRLFLIPVLILAGTGVYLSAEKFSLLPDSDLQFQDLVENATGSSDRGVEAAAEAMPVKPDFFQSQPLSGVRKVIFPFSEDPEDQFEVSLHDRQVFVHQIDGNVTREAFYPWVRLASAWSLKWHTGQGSVLWSVILLIASLSIAFFIYSGLSMSVQRLKRPRVIESGSSPTEAEFVILTGSETRNTYRFAGAFQKALAEAGKKVYLADMDAYSTYPRASHVIVFTSTYGDGDPPSNAHRFKDRVKRTDLPNEVSFAVVGFGSLRYPGYCRFAEEVDELMDSVSGFRQLMPLRKNQRTVRNRFSILVARLE